MRDASPGLVVHFNRNDPRLGAQLLGVLREGGMVALQADRPTAGGRDVEVRLFDRPYRLPAGPFMLARAAGVPVLPVFATREGRRRTLVRVHPPIDVSGSASQTLIKRSAQAFASLLEREIRRTPHQWFCFSALWRETDPSW